MSSLQQALNNAANRLKLKKFDDNSKQNSDDKCGAFENSFAQGLDISELFSNSTLPRTNNGETYGDGRRVLPSQRTSAAGQLLKIKEGERRQREIQEEEEVKMQEALQKRLISLKQHSNNKNIERKESSFEIGDALVRMHDTDEMATVMLSQKVNTRTGGTANRRRNSSSRMRHKTNKSSFTKKSRNTKF